MPALDPDAALFDRAVELAVGVVALDALRVVGPGVDEAAPAAVPDVDGLVAGALLLWQVLDMVRSERGERGG
jgi:hypothetical protein